MNTFFTIKVSAEMSALWTNLTLVGIASFIYYWVIKEDIPLSF